MSLISTKNLLAPFTNKVHITTMLLIVFAFVALRISGGAIAIEKEVTHEPISLDGLPEPKRSDKNKLGKATMPWDKKKNSKKDKKTDSNNQAQSLDDIERLFN